MKSPQMPLRKITASLIAGVFLAGSAYADVTVKRLSPLGAGMSVNLTLPAGTGNYFSGFQNIEVVNGSNTSSFAALCVDPFQYSSNVGTTYTTPVFGAFFGGTKAAEITQLYNYAYFNIQGDDQKAAAFQLALWEIANDNQDLTSGLVSITTGTNGTNVSVVADAQILLSNFYMAATTPTYNFAVYSSTGKQDFLVATPVPEPGTYAMFLAGLGLMGAIARRRTKAS